VEWAEFDNKSGERRAIAGASTFDVPASASVYLVAQIRGERTGQQMDVFVRNGRDIVGRQMIGQPEGRELKLQTSLRR
jgi:hypothetical protein